MNKLYFKYGTMGSSKTAQALMCRFNYLQKGFKVLLVKPSADVRDKGIKSRIGIEADCEIVGKNDSFLPLMQKYNPGVVIVDESQFLTKIQVDELKAITRLVPVLCYGLLTNFKQELFEGSKRLVELADSIKEIKSVCRCGRKATVNARLINGNVVTDGPEILIGADEKYEGMCYWCYVQALAKNKK